MQVVDTRKIKLDEIVFHQEYYPRANPNTDTIEQYVDALREGGAFPPIEVDADGMVLLDGYHRWKAFAEAGFSEIEAKWVDLEGTPRLLYAASRNAIHCFDYETSDRLVMG